ncbi:unnamed protein product, partial [Staurois parvus]
MQGPWRPDIVNAGSRETIYSECRVLCPMKMMQRLSLCWILENNISGHGNIIQLLSNQLG